MERAGAANKRRVEVEEPIRVPREVLVGVQEWVNRLATFIVEH